MQHTPLDIFLSVWQHISSPAELPMLLLCVTDQESRHRDTVLSNEDVQRVCGAIRRKNMEWDLMRGLFALQQGTAGVPVRVVDLMVILLCWEATTMQSARWFLDVCARHVRRLLERQLGADAAGGERITETVVTAALLLFGCSDGLLYEMDAFLGEASVRCRDISAALACLREIADRLSAATEAEDVVDCMAPATPTPPPSPSTVAEARGASPTSDNTEERPRKQRRWRACAVL
ncbi:hypothetical protein TraAM80_06108 [Trypanosoma rangeli]|uniref:Uncharacterized protein n=1 Tax=Trypanosoma rangeli TaxID=5698 RepID=A0A422NBR0_TRYRA|nr:uncharacterized protein TraAM80_06108 [Trypanosoma rangeli]RNF02905.1 hypothetical protein TraAM80_06108 [Trypanosoma rangeli]|eukprot:RNF02905.1 hypothetical protein TraAM80_06108 [Trypanosoma rangeli]